MTDLPETKMKYYSPLCEDNGIQNHLSKSSFKSCWQVHMLLPLWNNRTWKMGSFFWGSGTEEQAGAWGSKWSKLPWAPTKKAPPHQFIVCHLPLLWSCHVVHLSSPHAYLAWDTWTHWMIRNKWKTNGTILLSAMWTINNTLRVDSLKLVEATVHWTSWYPTNVNRFVLKV